MSPEGCKIKCRLTYLLLSAIIVACGCVPAEPTSRVPPPAPVTSEAILSVPSVSAGDVSNPKLTLASLYKAESITIAPNAASYTLPLTPDAIKNLEKIESELCLDDNQLALLAQSGFVVIPWHGDDMVKPYETMKDLGIPIFVTCDTLLHLYHIQFNEILRRIEEEEFFDQLVAMTQGMLERAEADYQAFTTPDLREAARRNVAYFTVALKLLQTPTEGYDEQNVKADFAVPDYVKDEVEEEIKNIEEHEGFKPSAILNSATGCVCNRPCCYCEDYSQYVPRGHYTRSEVLKRYFKAMMWYGRMAFLLKGGSHDQCRGAEGPLVSEKDAKIAAIQASLISAQLSSVGAGETTAQEVWNRIYSITSFFVGAADDLTPYEYLGAMEKVFGTEFQASELADDEKLLKLEAELAQMRNPKIYGGSGVCVVYPPVTKEKLYECLSKTKGMRFMGQRFVPDSYIFQNLVSPAVGMYVGGGKPFTMKMTQLGPARCFPRGLDVMAVLDSDRAYEILEQEGDTEYRGEDTSYDQQLRELRNEFDAFTEEDWNRNLYWSWLYALRPLLEKFGSGYPAFMQTEAWQDKELTTALASWTELRHDTILYAKQSYTPELESMPPPHEPTGGYVEPIPEFYARMLALTRMTKDGLAQLNALSQQEQARLDSLGNILNKLLHITKKELEGRELDQSDYQFIASFGEQLDSVVAGVKAKGKETTIVADVHTDANEPRQVLEEGVGYVDLLLAAYQLPDGRIMLGAGPVLSYYEFKYPISDRLTDSKWKDVLELSQQPERPAWIQSYYGK